MERTEPQAENVDVTILGEVDAFIAPTEFDRSVFRDGGFTDAPIHVKPHFLPEPPAPVEGPGDYLLYVGRLAREKGIDVLVDAWRRLPVRIPLVVIGDGPLRRLVETLVSESGGMVTMLGRRSRHEAIVSMSRA